MKSYQRSLLSATLAVMASRIFLDEQNQAKKKKEKEDTAKKPIVRDWLCDLNKKNVGNNTCGTCRHKFKGMRRRKHCAACQPKVTQTRLAEEEIRMKDGDFPTEAKY